MDNHKATPAVTQHVVEMLERARLLASDATAARAGRGEQLTPRTPPVVASRVLDDLIAKVQDGSRGPSSRVLGLSRGASDFEWLPSEQQLVDLFARIDDYWQAHVWDGVRVEGGQPTSLRIRHRRPTGSDRR